MDLFFLFFYFLIEQMKQTTGGGKGYDQEEVERGSNVTHISF